MRREDSETTRLMAQVEGLRRHRDRARSPFVDEDAEPVADFLIALGVVAFFCICVAGAVVTTLGW